MAVHPLDLEAAARKYAEVNGFDYERHKKHLDHRMKATLEAYEKSKALRCVVPVNMEV
jgi:hypothetical protein